MSKRFTLQNKNKYVMSLIPSKIAKYVEVQKSKSHNSGLRTLKAKDVSLFSLERSRKARESIPIKPSTPRFTATKVKLSLLPPHLQHLINSDPATKKLVEESPVQSFRLFGCPLLNFGARRYGFRARAFWSNFRPRGFKRSGHRPGGWKLYVEERNCAMQREVWRRNVGAGGAIAKSDRSAGDTDSQNGEGNTVAFIVEKEKDIPGVAEQDEAKSP